MKWEGESWSLRNWKSIRALMRSSTDCKREEPLVWLASITAAAENLQHQWQLPRSYLSFSRNFPSVHFRFSDWEQRKRGKNGLAFIIAIGTHIKCQLSFKWTFTVEGARFSYSVKKQYCNFYTETKCRNAAAHIPLLLCFFSLVKKKYSSGAERQKRTFLL